jgi:hypothetical protein
MAQIVYYLLSVHPGELVLRPAGHRLTYGNASHWRGARSARPLA